ncbi:MAG: cytochrome c [Motiliproteus sp.]
MKYGSQLMKEFCALVMIVLLLAACSEQPDVFYQNAETGRWYSKDQLLAGRKLFRDNCAQCHGKRGEGAVRWNKPDAQGLYPPPPLNGSAHSWHHPYQQLYKTISEGSGGRMPAWSEQLNEQQIAAVMAYFQSLWPEQAYERWLNRHRR